MQFILSQDPNFQVLGSLNSASLAVLKCQREQIDLVLMDVVTKGNLDGIEATKEIKSHFPKTKVIIVTSMMEVDYLKRAREAGADSFWYKDESEENLLDVIHRTLAGEQVFPDKSPEVQIGYASSLEFTKREIEILRLLCDGLDYGEIADELFITRNTVKTHVAHILQKTGYENKTRLAIAVTNKTFIIPSILDEEL